MSESQRKFFRRIYIIDRVIAVPLLVIVSPVIGLLTLLVKVSSDGPGIYKQQRVGLNGKVFTIYKLRSMVNDAEAPGEAQWCEENDQRITRIGKVLRKCHLDELPQLYNVIRGDMSLVGPRPERPEICRELAIEIDGYYRRNAIKPGLTGLAQINLPPDTTVDDVCRKQQLDLLYFRRPSLWLYLRMIAASGLRLGGVEGEKLIQVMRLCRRQMFTESLKPHQSTDAEESNAKAASVGVLATLESEQTSDQRAAI